MAAHRTAQKSLSSHHRAATMLSSQHLLRLRVPATLANTSHKIVSGIPRYDEGLTALVLSCSGACTDGPEDLCGQIMFEGPTVPWPYLIGIGIYFGLVRIQQCS